VALFAVYQALCKVIGTGAVAAGIPPAQVSFPHALAAGTDSVAAFPPDQPEHALARHSRRDLQHVSHSVFTGLSNTYVQPMLRRG
jgi:hypothetical protein